MNRQLNIAFGLVLIVPLLLATIFLIWYYSGKIKTEALAKIEADAKAAKLILAAELAEVGNRARDYARSKQLVLLSGLLELDDTLKIKIGRDFSKTSEDHSITVIDPSAKILIRSDKPTELNGHLFHTPQIEAAFLGTVSSGIGQSGEKLNITGIAPVYDRNEKITSAVIVRREIGTVLMRKISRLLGVEAEIGIGIPVERTFLSAIDAESISHSFPIFKLNGSPVGWLTIRTSAAEYVRTRDFAISVLLGIFILGLVLTYIVKEIMRSELESSKKYLEIQSEQLQDLNRKLFRSQEAERRKISLDLHDGIIQTLSALLNQYTMIERNREDLRECNTSFKHAISDLRGIVDGMHPTGLEEFGISEALSLLCFEFREKTKINVEFTTIGDDDGLGYDSSIALFRIAQEALNNISKHARAESVSVKLVNSHHETIVRIADDGIGFDVDRYLLTRNANHMGLRGMRERMSAIGGEFEIKSTINQGTKINTRVAKTAQ